MMSGWERKMKKYETILKFQILVDLNKGPLNSGTIGYRTLIAMVTLAM